jgi:hypothetical protein
MMNWKGYGRKRWWPVFKYCTRISLKVVRKAEINLGQVGRLLGGDSNPGLADYEVGIPTIEPWCTVRLLSRNALCYVTWLNFCYGYRAHCA